MSTKALKRELAAAIAMLLVAMIALSGSTYAWFASNNKVEAQDMTVTAMSDAAFLEITTEGTDFTGSSVQASALEPGSTSAAILPVTPFKTTTGAVTADLNVSGGTITWSYTYSDSVSSAAMGATQKWKVVGSETPTPHAIGDHALVNTFYFRMNVEGVTGTKLVATTDGISGTFAEALDKGATLLLAGPDGYQVITQDGAGNYRSTLYGTDGKESASASLKEVVPYCDKANETDGVPVTVYFYYNGEVDTVYTDNLVAGVAANIVALPFVVNQ